MSTAAPITTVERFLGADSAATVRQLDVKNPGYVSLIAALCEVFAIANAGGLSTQPATEIMDDHLADVIDTAEAITRMAALAAGLRDVGGAS